jgi:hypothetical protein
MTKLPEVGRCELAVSFKSQAEWFILSSEENMFCLSFGIQSLTMVVKPEGSDYFGDQSVDRKIILK